MYKISLKNIDVHREYEHGDTTNKFVVAFQTGKGHNDALLQRMVLGRHLREENAAWQKYDEHESVMNFNEQNFEDEQKISSNNVRYFKKIILPSEQEKNQHNQYLKTSLKKNFFN